MRTPNATLVVALLLGAVTVAGCGGSPANPPTRTSRSPHSPSSTTRPATASPHRATPAPTKATDPDARRPLIDHVRWAVTAKGRQLQVFPTRAGRTDSFPAAATRAWAEVLTDAPNAATAGMYDQFRCHWNYARVVDPTKSSWDLEPWRPAVGYAATVAALCNPGGSEG